MLFQLCRTPIDLIAMLKLCAMGLVICALHGIFQFIVVALGLVAAQGSVELLGYEFVNVGWAGIYRVAYPIGNFNLVRIQSFFRNRLFRLLPLVGAGSAGLRTRTHAFRHARCARASSRSQCC
jgi:hypothetical protein